MKISKYMVRSATALTLAASLCVSGVSAPAYAEAKEDVSVVVQNTDSEEIADGVYTANVTMRNASNPAQNSMSNEAVVSPVIITVKDGTYTVTASFHGITIELLGMSFFGYLKELSYKDAEGNFVPATVNEYFQEVLDMYNAKEDGTAKYYYPKELSFPLVNGKNGDSMDGYVELQVFVPIMDDIAAGSGTQRVFMDIDWSSLKAVSETTETSTPEPDATAEPETTATVTPEQIASSAPETTATITPEQTAPSAPETTATITPEQTVTPAPEATATGIPEQTVTSATEATATVTPEQTAEPVPEATATGMPEISAPSATATVTPESPAPSAPDATVAPALKEKDSVTVGNNRYTVTAIGKSPTVEFNGSDGKRTSIVIPATIQVNQVTYKVTSIKAGACKNNKKITSVTISKNITKIGKNAFYGASKLKKISIKAKALRSIGTKAFSGIAGKAVITLPSGLSKKQKAALKKKLKKAGIPKSAIVK